MDRRYLPQLRLPGWQQDALARHTVLIVGVGGLGLPAALYLAAMGAGRLILADPDTIAEENLHRQPLYTPDTIGQHKVNVLSQYLNRLRPDLHIECHTVWVAEDFLRDVGRQAAVWIDGTDNLESRLLMDAVASELEKPWVYGAIFQWEGQVALLSGVSYRSVFGEATGGPSCSEAGVLGALPGIIGSWQAALTAQYLAAPDSAPVNRLFRIDLRRGESQTFWLANGEPGSLDISLSEARRLSTARWIDMRAEAQPALPVPAERRAWYEWDTWQLPNGPVILVCEAGNRSRQIAYALRKKTLRRDIFSLQGGALLLLADGNRSAERGD